MGDEFKNYSQDYSTKSETWERLDTIGRRKLLKDNGYSIFINGKTATSSYGHTGREVWTLLKRIQRNRLYLLQELVGEIKEIDYYEAGSENFIAIDENGKVFAENRKLRY